MSLITNIEQVREVVNIASTDERMPDFDTTERIYLIPTLGNTLYQQLLAAVAGTPTTAESNLISRCRSFIIPMTYARTLAYNNALLTNNGIRQAETSTSDPAPRWAYLEYKETLYKQAADAQENMMSYLIDNKADYPAWDDTRYNNSIIASGAELTQAMHVHQPNRSSLLLQPLYEAVTDRTLIPGFGREFITDLITTIRNGAPTTEESSVFLLLQKGAARMAMAMAAKENNLTYTDAGFIVGSPGRDSSNSDYAKASTEQLRMFTDEMISSAQAYFEDARKYLNANASESVFPLFYDSEYYTAPTSRVQLPPHDNSDYQGIFVI